MRRQAIDNLRAAIEANTQRRTLDQLRAQGKQHVRIVSGEKVMEIIKAIVGDIVDREVGDATARDREKIVSETKQQFDRVLKIQTEQEAMLQEQKEISKQYKAKFDRVGAAHQQLQKELEDQRRERAEHETRLREEYQARISELKDRQSAADDLVQESTREKERLTQLLEDERRQHAEREKRVNSDYEARLETAKREQKDLVARLNEEKGAEVGRQEKALAKVRERAETLAQRVSAETEAKVAATQRVHQLEKDLKDVHAQREDALKKGQALDTQVHALESRLENSQGENEQLQEELEALRKKASQADAVTALGGQIAQMQQFLRALDERSAGVDENTVNALLEQLSQRESLSTQELEERFNASLDASLDKITKTMTAATAKPIDIAVEATDVLVDKLFDGDYAMSTNLDDLEVDEKTSKKSIAGTLAALKKMRAGKAKSAEGGGDSGQDPEGETSRRGKKVKSNVERLKAVRGGKEKGSKQVK
ncbi:MAG: hypothetical protein ACYTEZ_09400 [Planctomycetota bacterium]|jgi:DNA repair exonuclease SbcCD ATPase subunit